MQYRTIMVAIDDDAASAARLEIGVKLAERWSGRLVAVAFSLAEIPVVFADAYTAAMFDAATEAARVRAEAAKRQAEAALGAARCDWETRIATGVSAAAGDAAAKESLYADLCVLGAPSSDEGADPRELALLQGALFDGAAPVLAVPRSYSGDGVIGRAIAIAWDARREAARAARAATPFFADAASVDTLTVSHFWGSEPYGPVPGLAFSHWLARHGANCELRPLAGGGTSVAETIIADVTARERDLLVMGAYGHSRLREALFGGVTESLIHNAPTPILLAH